MGEGGGVDDTLGEELVGVVVVVLLGDLLPPPHPTAKTSTAAPPNSAIAVLAPDFIRLSIRISGGFVYTRSVACANWVFPLSSAETHTG